MGDNSELLNKVHRMVLEQLSGSGAKDNARAAINKLASCDTRLRKAVAELYIILDELNNPEIAVDLLAEHVAILVEMINQFKKPK